jgi:group I intron endonuclease
MSHAPLGWPAILYRITNLITGELYIGITTKSLKKRAKVHRDAACVGSGWLIGAAFRKYGKNNLKFETLIVCPSWEYAQEMERRCIEVFKPAYNITAGGSGVLGYKHTSRSLRRISEVQKGNKNWLGKRHSEETRRKMSAARSAYWAKRRVETIWSGIQT